MAVSQRGYTTGMAAEATGLSMDQLRYLAAKELVLPSFGAARGRGSFARYSFDDLIAMQVVAQLRSQGDVTINSLRAALLELQKLTDMPLHDAVLYTADWRTFHVTQIGGALSDLVARQLTAGPLLVMVALGALERMLLDRLGQMGLAAGRRLAA
jgi:DNA-binding transcriptional MerR regulator